MAFLLLIGNNQIGLPKLNMDICNYIDVEIYKNNLQKVAYDERVDILEKNQKNKNIYNLDFNQKIKDIWFYAAKLGKLNIIKWLHYNKIEGCASWTMNIAAIHGHLEIVKFLHFNRKEGCSKMAIDWAADNGYLEIVKWLHENRNEGCTTWAMNFAAENGHLEIVKWLHENRTEGCTQWAIDNAKTQEIKNYLINNNCLKKNN